MIALFSIASHLFTGVETAFPPQAIGPDTNYYTGELFPRKRQSRHDTRDRMDPWADANVPLPLLLPPAVGGAPEVIQSNAPVQPASCEPAGVSHQLRLHLRAGIQKEELERSRSASAGEGRTSSPTKSRAEHDLAGDDHYNVLGLGELRWRATDDQIKKAYHRTSLRCHPDKVRGAGVAAQQAADDHYKKVNRAYAILSDPQKRFGYDSMDETFDMLPTEEEVRESGFYAVMNQYFEVNARWSVDRRVPTLGNASSTMEEVDRFYHFWHAFKSKRDFSQSGEHDPELATNRFLACPHTHACTSLTHTHTHTRVCSTSRLLARARALSLSLVRVQASLFVCSRR